MFGVDEQREWYDYDLTSAYTTGMTDLSLPDYYNSYLVDVDKIKD
jgi:hypothetical protein